MIASFSRKFIFIKTRKTGGTSVEIALSALCAGADIVTTISAEDEILRRDYGARARNFTEDAALEWQFFDRLEQGDMAGLEAVRHQIREGSPFYNHMPAVEVRQALPAFWDQAVRFTIERHPYERAVSLAWWRLRSPEGDLDAQIERAIRDPQFPSHPQYMERGRLLVDRVIDHARLREGLAEVLGELGAELPPLPAAKSQHRKDRRPAAEVLTQSQKDRIYEATAPEFELMGYER